MLRRICALSIVLALMGMTVATAGERAQAAAAAADLPGGRGGMAMMLRMKPVQEELKLSADQTEAVTKIAEEAGAAMRESFGNLRDASPEERRAAGEKMAKQMAETDKKVAEVLKPEQSARLKELSVQMRGTFALMDPEVATALKLTDDQKKKLADMAEANRPARGQGAGGGGGASAEDRAAPAPRPAQNKKPNAGSALPRISASSSARCKAKSSTSRLRKDVRGWRRQWRRTTSPCDYLVACSSRY